ncbi:MAG: tyrosine--tRNA ligase [Planctomycetota bacterium]|jgi:tyrosyl-tRNA synthetase
MSDGVATATVLDELAWRGLLYQTTGEAELLKHLATPGRVAYAGFDPTADSLTIGNFIPIKLLAHWQRAGHVPIALMGGGTGLIGDPSGKCDERQLLSPEQVRHNVECQRSIFERVLDFDAGCSNRASLVNNADWLLGLGFVEVLRDVGKHFSVNAMIQKESVRARLQEREHGISYTEFSYMILQAYDFLHLRRAMDCTVQMAGSDQFGNIVAGIDLIRREMPAGDNDAFGITAPLVTKADGKKIGKTETGAVWLTAERTSPYAFYQFWINADDADVGNYLKWFTFLGRDEVEGILERQSAAPHERAAQVALAEHMTEMMHGPTELDRAKAASAALFSGAVRGLDERTLAEVFADVPHSTHDKASLAGDGVVLVDVLVASTLASSRRQAREFLGNGAISVNGERVDADRVLRVDDLLPGGTILLRRGKKSWHATKWG